ncbi:hypothetical protein CLAFUR4_11240 [Fulvia fulva]|uniref:Mutant Avr4E n=1 Tax=Passalora fulva TaxID=5499 RepID=Q5VB05_PASFU|nr:mutant Avr4E precursor [Fulvia fulva]KAK4619567.1 hypothetical protein CLAFUR4_11240 [Fulvia fulva]KAK4620304.1 hypothetical protein CLAFUR0_11245 [Fulvia fulva]
MQFPTPHLLLTTLLATITTADFSRDCPPGSGVGNQAEWSARGVDGTAIPRELDAHSLCDCFKPFLNVLGCSVTSVVTERAVLVKGHLNYCARTSESVAGISPCKEWEIEVGGAHPERMANR